jgi:hypothetical protein
MIPKTIAPAEKCRAVVGTKESTLTDIAGICIVYTNCAARESREIDCDRTGRYTYMLRAMERTSVTCMITFVNVRVRTR